MPARPPAWPWWAAATWHAKQGAQALDIEWRAPPAGAADSKQIAARLEAAAREAAASHGGFAFHTGGDVQAASAAAARRIEALYQAPYLAHAAMEPINCTARVKDGQVEVWAPTQVPDMARADSRARGRRARDAVTLHVTYLGGGFGRRLEVDYVGQAVRIALETNGRPVQLVWSREEDIMHDFYRPAGAALMQASIDAQGAVTRPAHHQRRRHDHAALDRARPARAGRPDRRARQDRQRRPVRPALCHCATSASPMWPRAAACRWASGARSGTRTTPSSPRASSTSWRTS